MTAQQGVNARSLAAFYAAAVGKTGVQFLKEEKPDFSIDLSKYLDMQKKEIRSESGELYWNYGDGLRHRQHAAHAGRGRLPFRRAREAERLRDSHRATASPPFSSVPGTASR